MAWRPDKPVAGFAVVVAGAGAGVAAGGAGAAAVGAAGAAVPAMHCLLKSRYFIEISRAKRLHPIGAARELRYLCLPQIATLPLPRSELHEAKTDHYYDAGGDPGRREAAAADAHPIHLSLWNR